VSEVAILILLYAVGILFLLVEIFIPSHGILTLAGLGFLVAAVVKTFNVGGKEAGIIAIFACLIFLPAFAFLAIKYWPRTPIGRQIAPPNPTLTSADTSIPVEELARHIGRGGRAISPLRPVGICEFDGRRISCIAEFGMVDAGAVVEGVAVKGGNLSVVEKKT